MVGSRCVVQGCSNRRNKAAGLALHASPTDRTRDLWVRFVRIQCENLFLQPQAVRCTSRKIVLLVLSIRHSVGNLNPVKPSIWGRKEPSTERDSTRQSRMKEKEQRKLRFLWVLLMLYICAFMHRMFDILISPI